MPDFTKVSGVAEPDIVKISGVDKANIIKVAGQTVPAGGGAARWIVGNSGGVLYSTVVSDASSGWGSLVDLGGMNIKAVAYGEDSLGGKLWVIGTTSTSHEIAYCEDNPDALARNFAAAGIDPKWVAVDIDPSIKAADGGPEIAYTNTAGVGGTDRVWVSGGVNVGTVPNSQSIKRSTDGAENWTVLADTDIPQQQQPTRSMCYKSGRDWFATNDSDVWGSSDDGATWSLTIEDPGTLSGVFNAMAYDGNSKWVVVGNSGAIGYSTNDWASGTEATDSGSGGPFTIPNDPPEDPPIPQNIYGVVYCAGTINKWVACSKNGKIGYSSDGDTWTAATEDVATDEHFRAIATDGTTVVVVGDAGKIYTSTNGTSFTSRSGGGSSTLWSVACDIIGSGMR
jgi:hypothetical protein